MFLICIGFARTSQADELYQKHFEYKTLSPLQKQIFDEFIEEELPKGSALVLDEKAGARNKMRLACALFYRNQAGDVQKAVRIIQWIFTLQNVDEKSKNYAVWRGDSKPTENYDQNMREFIGTDLITVYHKYREKLPNNVKKELETCLIRTAKGALMRDVNPDYNNISIMSSFMMEYIGTAFAIPELKEAGIAKAKAIYTNFQQYHTLCEYNTPTYYGVDFVGLALWRELSFSNEMKEMSKVLEKELWLDVAAFYNANLQNMCGPYLRSYGIDMKKYNAIVGTWIAAAVDNPRIANLPDKHGVHDECNFIVPIVELGISMPVQALAQFNKFDSPRFITRTTSNYYEGDRLKRVTAYIQKDWMMGGLWGNRKVSHILKTGTMHWKCANGDIGWLFVPGEGKTNVKVDEKRMEIYLADTLATTFQIFVYAKNVTSENFKDHLWQLPNMNLGIKSELSKVNAAVLSKELIDSEGVGTKDYPFVINVEYTVPPHWNIKNPLVTITPNY
ncbi:MAG: hypothetical protein WCJ44_06505 [Runella sp.]